MQYKFEIYFLVPRFFQLSLIPRVYEAVEAGGCCPRKVIKKKFQVKSTLPIPNMLRLGGGGVQGQGKGKRLMGIKAVDDYIGLATCQSRIYEKKPPLKRYQNLPLR